MVVDDRVLENATTTYFSIHVVPDSPKVFFNSVILSFRAALVLLCRQIKYVSSVEMLRALFPSSRSLSRGVRALQ